MPDFSGLRVLVVEDEAGIAFLLEDMLQELGCQIAASAAHFGRAMEAAKKGCFDMALLDVNLDGRQVFPIAKVIQDRRIPIVFSTGYGGGILGSDFENPVVLTKPFTLVDLRKAITRALGQSPAERKPASDV